MVTSSCSGDPVGPEESGGVGWASFRLALGLRLPATTALFVTIRKSVPGLAQNSSLIDSYDRIAGVSPISPISPISMVGLLFFSGGLT